MLLMKDDNQLNKTKTKVSVKTSKDKWKHYSETVIDGKSFSTYKMNGVGKLFVKVGGQYKQLSIFKKQYLNNKNKKHHLYSGKKGWKYITGGRIFGEDIEQNIGLLVNDIEKEEMEQLWKEFENIPFYKGDESYHQDYVVSLRTIYDKILKIKNEDFESKSDYFKYIMINIIKYIIQQIDDGYLSESYEPFMNKDILKQTEDLKQNFQSLEDLEVRKKFDFLQRFYKSLDNPRQKLDKCYILKFGDYQSQDKFHADNICINYNNGQLNFYRYGRLFPGRKKTIDLNILGNLQQVLKEFNLNDYNVLWTEIFSQMKQDLNKRPDKSLFKMGGEPKQVQNIKPKPKTDTGKSSQTKYTRTEDKISVKTNGGKMTRLQVYTKGERGIRYCKIGKEYKLCSEIEKANKKFKKQEKTF